MNNNSVKFLATEEDIGKRLDFVLSKKIADITRSSIKKIIELNKIL